MADFNRKKLQVFVSSTFSDLIKERQAAVEAILAAGHIPAGMELFMAGDESQMEVIKQWIDESDVYLLILGGRYGSIDQKSGKSYTQLEYEYALSKNKPLFACVIKEEAIELRAKKEGVSVIETENPEKLKAFRKEVLSRVCRFWEDHKDIKITIIEKLSQLARRENLIGWVQANSKANLPDLAEELTRLSKENAKLRENFTPEFRGLVAVYSRTKALILRAEQVDPNCVSNIAVIKEMRDAADHLMRVLAAIYSNPPDDSNLDDYVKAQFSKSRAHLLRAAYDSLDGLGISCKLALKQALDGISNDAISAVYPEYWQKIPEFEVLDQKIAEHRNSKDVDDNTLAHLESYSALMERLYSLTQEFRQRIPQLLDWQKRNKKSKGWF